MDSVLNFIIILRYLNDNQTDMIMEIKKLIEEWLKNYFNYISSLILWLLFKTIFLYRLKDPIELLFSYVFDYKISIFFIKSTMVMMHTTKFPIFHIVNVWTLSD